MTHHSNFQPDAGIIRWKLHFDAARDVVFDFLRSPDKRKRYWAESAEEDNGVIHYIYLNGIECKGRILESLVPRRFRVEFFSWEVTFELSDTKDGGCDMAMTCQNVSEEGSDDAIGGWVSWLMVMKAAVDFGVDLRNHDAERTWLDGFVNN